MLVIVDSLVQEEKEVRTESLAILEDKDLMDHRYKDKYLLSSPYT